MHQFKHVFWELNKNVSMRRFFFSYFLMHQFKHVFLHGAQKNRLIETRQFFFSTHNMCFGLEIRKIFFIYALLSGGLFIMIYFFLYFQRFSSFKCLCSHVLLQTGLLWCLAGNVTVFNVIVSPFVFNHFLFQIFNHLAFVKEQIYNFTHLTTSCVC